MTENGDDWIELLPETLIADLMARAAPETIPVIGVDGRSRSGKTTLAGVLACSREHVALIHTDDIAWHHSFFDWSDALIDGVLKRLRRTGPPVSFIPRPWTERGRPGYIHIPDDTRVVIVEGVGATRGELVPWLDATVWVTIDKGVAMQRTAALDRDPPGFVREWMAAEDTHLNEDQPWTRASVIVSGEQPGGPRRKLLVRCGPGRAAHIDHDPP